MIVAIWAKDLSHVYNAYDVAEAMGYHRDSLDPRRNLAHHMDEYLVWSGIADDDYRLLAIFDSVTERQVRLGVQGPTGDALIPDGLLKALPDTSPAECLEIVIYCNTGIKGQSQQLVCLTRAILGV